MKKLKICHVTPGTIEIPPKHWGAIEKVIWNYKLQLEKLGHQCDIQLPWDVKKDNYDIIHVHTSNQCVDDMVRYQNVPYIYSMHDHHTIHYGKDHNIFKLSLDAIKKSIVSFTFSKTMVDFFDETDKLFFMSHGVDTEIYNNYNNPLDGNHKLLCVGNNGYANDQTYDRKGFRYAIEAARKLNLPITIVGPLNNNNFFDNNKDLLDYDKLEIIFEPNEKALVDIYNQHTIFIHPSELEAGHPNLTLLEAMSCGLPVVGTCDTPLDGMVLCNRNTNSVVEKIKFIIENYDSYINQALDTANKHSWENIVKSLENTYYNICNIKDEYTHNMFRDKLIYLYETSEKQKYEPKIDININFNKQAFVEIKSPVKKKFDIKIFDKDKNELVYNSTLNSNMWSKVGTEYYKNWKVEIEYDNKKIIRELELTNKNVIISMDSKSLGDTIAWFPYMEEFRKKHNCEVYCSTFHNYLFEKEYPKLHFIEPGSTVDNIYTSYSIGWFSPPWGGPKDKNPNDYRTIPLQQTATDILGLEYREIRPRIVVPDGKRPIPEKYVCIAHHSTASAKFWHYPNGWQKLVDYLNGKGFKVMVIQKEATHLNPRSIINETGNQPLTKRLNQLKHCEFFIGVGSGLSWLAWGAGKKSVMISGFSKPFCEFTEDNIRIHNPNVCNGCFNDNRFEFDRGDWDWCPVYKNTDKHFICTKSITPEYVIEQLEKNQLIP